MLYDICNRAGTLPSSDVGTGKRPSEAVEF